MAWLTALFVCRLKMGTTNGAVVVVGGRVDSFVWFFYVTDIKGNPIKNTYIQSILSVVLLCYVCA